MRKTLRNILAAAIMGYAAIIGVSCQKEDNWEGDPIQVDLRSRIDTAVFRGEQIRIPFKVKSSKEVTVFLDRTQNLEASLRYDPNTRSGEATLALPFGKDNGSTFISIANGVPMEGKNIYVYVTPRGRSISMPDFDGAIPPEGGRITTRLETNLPEERVDIRYPEWMSAEIKDGKVILSTGKNLSFERNSGILVISDKIGEASECRIEIAQEWIGHDKTGEGYVTFPDKALLGGLIETWDKDGDRALSTEEAEAVTEIVLPGRGIRDITGIGQLKRLEKIDLRDNMIEDATELRELYYLHWLDLKGNMSLRTFDVTGCCVYFDHCDYEVTDDLVYYTNNNQIGICGLGSPDYFDSKGIYQTRWLQGWPQHSKHLIDDSQTTDWSEHDKLIKIRDKKRQKYIDGKPYDVAFVVYVKGFVDRDVKDGSYERLARDFDKALSEEYPDVWDYVDIYYMTHLYPNRMCYMISTDFYTPEYMNAVKLQAEDTHNTRVKIYNTLYGNDNSGYKCVLYGEFMSLKNVWFNGSGILLSNENDPESLEGPREIKEDEIDSPYLSQMLIGGSPVGYGKNSVNHILLNFNNTNPLLRPNDETLYMYTYASIETFINKYKSSFELSNLWYPYILEKLK